MIGGKKARGLGRWGLEKDQVPKIQGDQTPKFILELSEFRLWYEIFY